MTMRIFRRESRQQETTDPAAERVRAKYASFRDLLALNNESLELMAGLQDDLQYAPPRREVLGGRVGTIFQKIAGVVASLERLTGLSQRTLAAAVETQRNEIERFALGLEERAAPALAIPLADLDADAENDGGSKAAVLGEIRKRLGLPVPDGFVLTAEAYRQYCGIPLWKEIRDATHDLDLNDPEAIRRVSESLTQRALECSLPAAVESAIRGGAAALLRQGGALAVRSSARGEGNARSYAGQFLSLLNVPADQAVDAYRRVIAAKFSERALFYRLSAGLREVDTPMAALFLKMVPARAAGIMYTRDPANPKSKTLWITATRGLGLGIASGRNPADLFLVTRSSPHTVVERNLVRKEEEIILREGGGIATVPLVEAQDEPSLPDVYLRTLADWGVHVEQHFRAPQDIEWVLDRDGALWIVQSRPLANAEAGRAKTRPLPKMEPKLAGGRTVYPGRTSGQAFLVDEIQNIGKAPAGAVVFIRKPSPEIVGILPRIAGLVAEWGNVAGHAATLLREFQIPSVFQMTGAFERLTNAEPVSLDAVQARVYTGIQWPAPRKASAIVERYGQRSGDPISTRLLTLNLQDPAADEFRPSGCKSGHDVLRYCHEKAIETMFEINDRELERGGAQSFRKLETPLPLHLSVIDLGGGLALADPGQRTVTPAQIVSRPFQALWQGISHPEVTWTRQMPARFGDLASVMAATFTPRGGIGRALGQESHLLVADEYMNLNSRLAYHYSLVDACLSDTPAENYISFRFEGGGAAHGRRSLRACFLEKCLVHYGFGVDRRSDLVNGWFRKAPADQTAERLDLLGRLLACSSQLDMYMHSREVMNWFADQFILGNYAFKPQG
jgi:pyruvate,water dikinase